MATYAIGDIQGCHRALQDLLMLIKFDPNKDKLWFVGDLVNRGPQSLDALRLVKSLNANVVLGNHDLHLLAIAYGVRKEQPGDTLTEILQASDRDELIDWVRHQALLVHDDEQQYVMTHAGLAASWTLTEAQACAREVEQILRGDDIVLFLQEMYGNQPDYWDDQLTGMARLRCITNYLTRMRFCYADGRLDLNYKGTLANKPDELIPWYELKNRVNADLKIIFGHWAALEGKVNTANVFALDTGCVWGKCLTAMRLSDQKKFTVSCAQAG